MLTWEGRTFEISEDTCVERSHKSDNLLAEMWTSQWRFMIDTDRVNTYDDTDALFALHLQKQYPEMSADHSKHTPPETDTSDSVLY